MSGKGGQGENKGGGENRGQDTVGNALLVLSNGDVKHRNAGGRGRGTEVQGFVVIVRRVTVVGIVRHLAAVSTVETVQV